MGQKYIEILDTTFANAQSGNVSKPVETTTLIPILEFAIEAGLTNFEILNSQVFNSQLNTLKENPLHSIVKYRDTVGANINLQVKLNTITGFSTQIKSKELIKLHIKALERYGVSTITAFDILNDIENFHPSSYYTKSGSMMYEATINLLEPQTNIGINDINFYIDKIVSLLDSGIEFDSILFNDINGSTPPDKIYEIIKFTRELVGEHIYIRLESKDNFGLGITSYIAALEAGVDGLSVSSYAFSKGLNQPNILTLLTATKGMGYNLGDLDFDKVLKYQIKLEDLLKEYIDYKEGHFISPAKRYPTALLKLIKKTNIIPQQINNDNLNIYSDNLIDNIFKAFKKIVRECGHPYITEDFIDLFWGQALINIEQGEWSEAVKECANICLGYYGKTPIVANPETVAILEEKTGKKENFKSVFDKDYNGEIQTISSLVKILQNLDIEATNENILFYSNLKPDIIF